MRSTFKLLFYINRNKVRSDGTTAVLCRISIDGKKSAVTTGIYCRPGDWDSTKGEIKTARENNRLAAFRSRLEEAYANLLRNQGVVTAELLKTTVSGTNSVPEYLLQAGEVERERLRVRSKEINSTSTYRQSKTTQLNLRQFIESRGMKDIAFSDITEEFAESFKVFLKKELGYRNSHVNHCLCWLNRLIYIAVDREILRANPIEDVAYEKKEPLKLRHISRGELKRMMETPAARPDDGACTQDVHLLLADRSGLCGHESTPSPAHRKDLGRKKIYPRLPGQDGRGGVHPAASHSRTDTGTLQHHG